MSSKKPSALSKLRESLGLKKKKPNIILTSKKNRQFLFRDYQAMIHSDYKSLVI
jgi:hypothetical protein